MKSEEFKSALSQAELTAWLSIIKIKENFLGKHRAINYGGIIVNGLKNLQTIGANMSLNIHFLKSHLDFFPKDLGNIGERFFRRKSRH